MKKINIFKNIIIFVVIFCSLCYTVDAILDQNLYRILIRLSVIPVIFLPKIINVTFKTKISDVSDDDKMYILRIVWIAARILMTNGGETISLFTPLNEYDSLFIDNDYYYIYRPAVLSMCSKMYYLCKAYNIDIPQYDSVPLDFN